MGCATSQNYPPDIFTIDGDDNTTFTTGNSKSTVFTDDNKHKNNNDIEPEADMGKNVLRGDVTQKYQAKRDREEKLRLKQKQTTTAAESLSSQAMEERETLSLTSRSRGTSRATSRTASPTTARKPAPYKPQMSEVNSEPGDRADNGHPHHNGEPARANS